MPNITLSPERLWVGDPESTYFTAAILYRSERPVEMLNGYGQQTVRARTVIEVSTYDRDEYSRTGRIVLDTLEAHLTAGQRYLHVFNSAAYEVCARGVPMGAP